MTYWQLAVVTLEDELLRLLVTDDTELLTELLDRGTLELTEEEELLTLAEELVSTRYA